MANEIYLTPEGKKQLEEKLEFYKKVKRPEATKAIGIAREFGDLKENSEYDQAKEEQGKIEAEIADMEATLRDAIVIAKKCRQTRLALAVLSKFMTKILMRKLNIKLLDQPRVILFVE